jgi:hypothetical protein
MTTFQDPPLQSRRSVRQNERDQSQPAVVASAAPAEPLTYTTQGRAPVPDYDGPAFRARRTPEPVNEADLATPAAQDPGTSRPRDFSPEGRRAASPSWAPQYGGVSPDGNVEYQTQARGSVPADPNSTFAPHAPVASTIIPSALDAEDALEHTLTRRELRALRDAHGITAVTTGEAEYPTPEAPAAAAPAVAPTAPDAAPASAGTPLAAPSTRLDSALAEFDQLAAGRPAPVPTDPPAPRGRRAAAAAAAAAAAPAAAPLAPEPVAPEPVAAAPVAPAPVQAAPVAPAPVAEPVAPAPAPAAPAGPAQIAPEALATPLVTPPTVAAAPQAAPEIVVAELVAEPVAPAPAAPAEVAPAEAVIEATIEEVVEPPTSTPPTGHWSTQAQLDDETQTSDAPLSRNIGNTSGAITTSALVLPSIPNHDFGPLTSGEIMVTGSISLSEAFTTTGAHPAQLDESDLDHLLDPGDHQVASTDSQPVRAIKAVSTHTSSRGVIQTVKPKGTKGLTALIIAATGMAVVVGALFIVLVATGQL